MEGIFLSYRRDDTAGDAHRIYERLAEHFGDDLVFLDVEDIPLGVDFVDAITAALHQAAYVLISIGPKWLLVTDKDGHKRLDDPNDMVRYEIRVALKDNKRIVPMLIGGADMPSARELPADIAALVRRNGIAIRPEPDFDMDVDDLLEGLQPDRIVEARVPKVFRVGMVARNLGLGGGIGWGGSSLILSLLVEPASAFLLTITGLMSGFSGGALVGWLTGLLIRHKSPPLVGRKLVRMGITWSLFLFVTAIASGALGLFIAINFVDLPPPAVEGKGFGEAIGAIIGGLLILIVMMLLVTAGVIIIGFLTGSAIAAGFFARQFRLRSDQISRWRALLIAVVWMFGGVLTGVLYLVLFGLLSPDN